MTTRCAHCGKTKTIPEPFKGKKPYIAREVYEADPYCSRLCAEAAHGRNEAADRSPHGRLQARSA